MKHFFTFDYDKLPLHTKDKYVVGFWQKLIALISPGLYFLIKGANDLWWLFCLVPFLILGPTLSATKSNTTIFMIIRIIYCVVYMILLRVYTIYFASHIAYKYSKYKTATDEGVGKQDYRAKDANINKKKIGKVILITLISTIYVLLSNLLLIFKNSIKYGSSHISNTISSDLKNIGHTNPYINNQLFQITDIVTASIALSPDDVIMSLPEFGYNKNAIEGLFYDIKKNPDITTKEIKQLYPELFSKQQLLISMAYYIYDNGGIGRAAKNDYFPEFKGVDDKVFQDLAVDIANVKNEGRDIDATKLLSLYPEFLH